MNRTMIVTAVAAALTVPVVTLAQGAAATEQDKVTIEQRVAATGAKLIATVETRITPGRPYSAEAVTESLQVLGDGNRISRRNMTRVFRDSQGRTRREQTGPGGESITISDPVGAASFTLDPATRTAFRSGLVAFKSPMPTGVAGGRGGGGGMFARTPMPAASGSEAGNAEEARRREKETAARVEMAETSREASSQMKQVLERAASGGGTTTREDLGRQTIEGVVAAGTRNTTVIPAGGIGNAQEIRIVSEQWFSPDLEVLVMTKHSDPRVGETIYRLTNIVRAEPDPALFTVPGDYTVKQRGVRQPQ